MAKSAECDMILKYHLCSVCILNITKWIKSNQLICPDPELLHDMWLNCINISTIKNKMSQDTLTKLITAVINIFYPAIGLSLVSSSSSFVIINKLTYLLLLFPNTEPMCRPASVIIIYLHKNIFILSLLFT